MQERIERLILKLRRIRERVNEPTHNEIWSHDLNGLLGEAETLAGEVRALAAAGRPINPKPTQPSTVVGPPVARSGGASISTPNLGKHPPRPRPGDFGVAPVEVRVGGGKLLGEG